MGVKAESTCPLRVSWEKWQTDPMKIDKPKKRSSSFSCITVCVCEDMQAQASPLSIVPKALKLLALAYSEPGTVPITEQKI